MYQFGSLRPGFIPESFESGSGVTAYSYMGPANSMSFAGPRVIKYTTGTYPGVILAQTARPSVFAPRAVAAPVNVDK